MPLLLSLQTVAGQMCGGQVTKHQLPVGMSQGAGTSFSSALGAGGRGEPWVGENHGFQCPPKQK